MTGFQYIDPAVIHLAAQRGENVYPFADYRPIPEAATQPDILPWSFILHTMGAPGSTAPSSLWRYYERGDINLESHLILGYQGLIQTLPFTVRADNNYKANRWWQDGVGFVGAISVETQDDGTTADPGIAKSAWNLYQIEHLAGIAAFLHLRYKVPLGRCATASAPGVDGHRAHQEWSKYQGKTCPGDVRWNQIIDVLRLARIIADWTSAPAPAPQPSQPPHEKGDMARINGFFIRAKGTEDHFLCIPQTTDSKARLEPDAPTPLTVVADLDQLERLAGYTLTARPGES